MNLRSGGVATQSSPLSAFTPPNNRTFTPNHPASNTIILGSSSDEDLYPEEEEEEEDGDEDVEEEEFVGSEEGDGEEELSEDPSHFVLRTRGVETAKQLYLADPHGLVCRPGFCRRSTFTRDSSNYCFYCAGFRKRVKGFTKKKCHEPMFQRKFGFCSICQMDVDENTNCKDLLLYSADCNHVIHGYCLFSLFGGCECEFTLAQMKQILGARIGSFDALVTIPSCPFACSKGDGYSGVFTSLRIV
jgi:hypothetical protein